MSSVIFNKQFDEQLHRTNRVPHGPEARAQGIPGQIVFRISGVPQTWTEDDVLNALKSVDEFRALEVQKCHVALYPACCGPFQIGLLNTGSSLKSFCAINDDRIKLQLSTQNIQYLFIDRHFYDLTPLNTPGNDIFVDVIAVTGLRGHAFGSWTSRETNKMWLKDFLPFDVQGIRIMTYGYNSSLIENNDNGNFLDCKREFLQSLANARRSNETRPIVFIGHDMGGILILQSLLQSKQDDKNKNVYDSTRAIFFFGTPQLGLNSQAPLEMTESSSEDVLTTREGFVRQFDEGSNFLSTQRDDITHLLGHSSHIDTVSFYETIPTPKDEKILSGQRVDGDGLAMVVKKNAALLFLHSEHRVPVRRNHSDIVKFPSRGDTTYQTVVTHLSRCVDKISKEKERMLVLSDEHHKCFTSLKASDYESYRDKHLRKRHRDTCSWVFSHQGYRSWLEDDDRSTLWIHGGPGFGKTVLSSVLTKELHRNPYISLDKDYSIAYHFCDGKDESLRTSYALLSNLLDQLLRQDPEALVHFSEEKVYMFNKETTSWDFDMLWRVFRRVVSDNNLRAICVIIDALDECENASRTNFLEHLRDLLSDSQSKPIGKRVKIAITSRPHIPVQLDLLDVIELPLDINYLKEDITNYVKSRVLVLPERMIPIKLKNEIEQVLIERSNGMFLWVYLILHDLQTSTQASRHVIKQKLNSLPKDLPDLYNRILRNIKPEDLEIANTILRWVVWAKRPLTLNELTIAIAIEPGQRSMDALSEMMEPYLEGSLRSILGAMIIIQKNEVHLIHQSAKDFLKDPILTESEKISLRANEANLYISISCLTYLLFEEFEYAPDEDESEFFRYSSTHWLDHIKNLDAESETHPQMKAAFSQLGKSRKTLTLLHRVYCDTRGIKIYRDYQPIEIAASFGLIGFLEVLLDQSLDVSAENYNYGHILLIAIEFEHITLVRFLVERGADVNGQDGEYDTPLHKAIERGNNDLVHFLVKKGADVNIKDGKCRTPLHKAKERGNGAIVRFPEDQAYVNLGDGELGALAPTTAQAAGLQAADTREQLRREVRREWRKKERRDLSNEEADIPSQEKCFKYLKRYIHKDKPGLARFYDTDDKINNAATKAMEMVEKLCEGDEGCTTEIARDMQVLVLYDLVMLIDDSTSISDDGEPAGVRLTTLEKTLHAIAKIYCQVQMTGIRSVRFLNDNKGRSNVRPGNVGPMIKKHAWRGVTRIGTELERKILDYFVYEPKVVPRKLRKREKPLLIMTITDGAIEGEAQNTLQSVIEDCVNHLQKPEAEGGFGEDGADTVAFHFSRVGKDEDAAKLLNDLNNDKKIGKYIDCLPVDESSCLENMISSDRLVKWNIRAKLLLGAIQPHWGR